MPNACDPMHEPQIRWPMSVAHGLSFGCNFNVKSAWLGELVYLLIDPKFINILMLLPQNLPTNAIMVPQTLITTELHCLTSASIGPSEDSTTKGSPAAYPSGNPLQLVELP